MKNSYFHTPVKGDVDIMRQPILIACVAVFCLFASLRPAAAAERCDVKVESVDEDRNGFSSRQMWNSSLFSVTLLAREPKPTGVSLKVYTLGNAYRGSVPAITWYPSEVGGLYRSVPLTLAFPRDETFLHIGVTGLTDGGGAFHACTPRLYSAFSPVPRLALAPLNRSQAVVMHAARAPLSGKTSCPETPVRIAVHAPPRTDSAIGVPATGGPYVSLIAVSVARSGAIAKTTTEVSSGLPWLDQRAEASARDQQYSPATARCMPIPGTYYFADRIDTPDDDKAINAF